MILFPLSLIRAQTVSEKVLGTITLEGTIGPGHAISSDGEHYAVQERIGDKFRHVTTEGVGEMFDRLYPGAAWINGRLVYLAKRGEMNYLVDGVQLIELKGHPTSPPASPRPWISADRSNYSVFSSDGEKVTWYLNGKEQAQSFDRLSNVLDMKKGRSDVSFVGVNGCSSSLFGGQVPSGTKWDSIFKIRSSADGSVVLVYGERASLPVIFKNDTEVYREEFESLDISEDGHDWYGVVERSQDDADSVILLKNGEQVEQVDTDRTRQSFLMAPHGANWAWKIYDQDYTSATFILPGRERLKLNFDPQEFHVASDPDRYAYIRLAPHSQATAEVNVNGVILETKTGAVVGKTFAFGPGAAFAVIMREKEGQEFVLSQLGEGERFKEISPTLFCENGDPVYVARRGDQRFVVIGTTPIEMNADELFGLNSLTVEGNEASVLGKRDKTIVKFRIKKP